MSIICHVLARCRAVAKEPIGAGGGEVEASREERSSYVTGVPGTTGEATLREVNEGHAQLVSGSCQRLDQGSACAGVGQRLRQGGLLEGLCASCTKEGAGARRHRQEWVRTTDLQTCEGIITLSVFHSSRSYSPRAIYKGGGKYVCRLDSSSGEVEMPREKYAERIINFEKTREKHKEIHPPMAFLKNKPLSCAKYFVEDIICADNNSRSECDCTEASSGSKRRTSCYADCPPSPEKVNQTDEADGSDEEDHEERRRRKSAVYDRLYWNAHGSRATVLGGTATPEPPTTAEYVAHPKWRQHSPEKWVGGRPFTSTTLSSNAHTASRCSITGASYSRTLLLDEPFAPAGVTNSPTTPQVRAYEHSRRMKMAAEATYKPVQRPDKKYFNSMWTEPAESTKSRSTVTFTLNSDAASRRPTTMPSPLPSPSRKANAGRELLQHIRQQRQPVLKSPKRQHKAE